jgi:two-component system NtrC family sensor kinase
MKLALKIAAAVTIVIALVFGVDGVFRVQRQLRAFEADTRRDHLSMGRATAAAITESYLSYGESVAMDIIARIGRKTQKVHVGWVSHDTLGGADINAQLGPVPQAKLLTGSPVSKLRENKDGHREMITFVPVLPRGNVVGAVKISESLVRQSQYVRNTVIRTAATTIMAILICAGATLLLGFYLIGRPIRRLAQQAGSIGKGDFGKQLTFSQRDEIADLSNEMNTMAEKLVEAIQKIEFETKAHLETLDQLRHADRLKTVGQLTSGVVHEIGTPLTVIGGRAKMIETGEAEGGEARDCARIIVQQAEKVTGVVRQILNFARKDQDELGIQDIVPVVNRFSRCSPTSSSTPFRRARPAAASPFRFSRRRRRRRTARTQGFRAHTGLSAFRTKGVVSHRQTSLEYSSRFTRRRPPAAARDWDSPSPRRLFATTGAGCALTARSRKAVPLRYI